MVLVFKTRHVNVSAVDCRVPEVLDVHTTVRVGYLFVCSFYDLIKKTKVLRAITISNPRNFAKHKMCITHDLGRTEQGRCIA